MRFSVILMYRDVLNWLYIDLYDMIKRTILLENKASITTKNKHAYSFGLTILENSNLITIRLSAVVVNP